VQVQSVVAHHDDEAYVQETRRTLDRQPSG
jgi:hypothetical protein